MVATVSFNPVLTSSAAGTFNVSSEGYIQGQAMDDPAARNWLSSGVLATTETKPMWGGVAISENIPSTANLSTQNGVSQMGGQIIRATNVTPNTAGCYTGFAVFDQNHSAINSPQSPVPLVGTGMTMNFYRAGSNARIAVPCDPALISLQTGIITQQVSWDFNDSVLQPYDASTATYSVTSLTPTYNNNGTWTIAVVMAAASPVAAVGDTINVSGNTGTGASIVSGTQTVVAFTDNQHFSFLVAAGAGAIGAQGGTIVLNYGTGALNVRVLDVQVNNSMTVVYNSVTGFATWNRTGSTALILI